MTMRTDVSADPIGRLPGKTRTIYEAIMATLAIVVIVLLMADPASAWVHRVNIAVWTAFVADYAIRLALSNDRRRFMRTNVIDLVAILPLDFFRAARVLRLVRLVRLARAGGILWRVSATARGVMDTNGLRWVLAATAAVVVVGGVVIWVVEPTMGSIGDGLWWALVTATTVGYGDLSPVTPFGRGVAGVLMLVGIATIGMVTGAISTYFINDRASDLPVHVAFVRDELKRWNELSVSERHRLAVLLDSIAREDAPAS
jgi:voltage-gated potassium channel